MKLAVEEIESEPLREALAAWPARATSVVGRIELMRAVRRGHPSAVGRVSELLARISSIPLDDAVAQSAARLAPPSLRALDAIHLATALSLERRLGVFIAYDRRLLDAAEALGLPTLTPR